VPVLLCVGGALDMDRAAPRDCPMSWIDYLEKRFERFAIPHLLRYVALLNGLAFVLSKLKPGFLGMLQLDAAAVLKGEVWRLVSHIFVPSIGGLLPDWIGAGLYLLLLVWLGDGLEEAMGSFRTTLYYAIGLVGTAVAAFLAEEGVGGAFLTNSLFFAYAMFFPDRQILVFFVIPAKMKWLAWLDVFLLGFLLFTSGWGVRAGVVASFANFILFFAPAVLGARRRQREQRERFEKFAATLQEVETLHKCVKCGRTEVAAPELEFRVGRDGEEYCTEHLPGNRQGGLG
jgi:hypothetical protein